MIWLEIITALFAVALAWLNKWPVYLMRRYGMPSHRGEREFHSANAIAKVIWPLFFSLALGWPLPERLYLFLLLSLIQWLVFDPALNLFTGKPWHYLGETAFLDRLVRNGKIKALVVLVFIIILNVLL